MGSAIIRLNINDFNPDDTKRKKADLLKYASGFLGDLGMRGVQRAILRGGEDELVSFISAAMGRRVPEAFKVARAHGDVVESPPPFHLELNPAQHCWAQMKSPYSGRYDESSVVSKGLRPYSGCR